MRVLHTADWHLGQRFQHGHDRLPEHQCFLEWLLTTIEQYAVDVLVVAGDVFDTGNPPQAAQEQYYSFLAALRASRTCHDVVIVGGNHDAPATLNASGTLLKSLRVHVVGGVPLRFEDQYIGLPYGTAEPRLIVAAVPFLRDADVRRAVAGETADEREARTRDGIADHYRRVGEGVGEWRERGVPVLATGHLFAAGGEASDSEKLIHLGNLGQITANAFPAAFDYVALGHLHRPQIVGKRQHIRYSGAPVPLSFSEAGHDHQVLLLTFAGAGAPTIAPLRVPCTRRLVRFRGALPEVLAALAAFDNETRTLPAWADVLVEDTETTTVVQDQLRAAGRLRPEVVRVLSFRHVRPGAVDANGRAVELSELTPAPLLAELTETDVFGRFLDGKYAPGSAERMRLEDTFAALLVRMSHEVTAE